VTGGTGSSGRDFVEQIFAETGARRVIVFSRDEMNRFEIQP